MAAEKEERKNSRRQQKKKAIIIIMKKYFITGLVILLPLALTIAIVMFIFNLFTVPFLGIVKVVFDRYHLFEEGFFLLNASQLQNLVAQILILGSLFFISISLGFIARWFFFKTLIKFAEYVVRKIPLVRTIYKTCQDIINTIFTSKTKSFKQVVLVRFPNSETFSIGLITRDAITHLAGTSHQNAVAVFVPTTPNPTSGFLMIFKPEDLIYLDMKVEDAFKYIISCGVISPDFNPISKEEAHHRFEIENHHFRPIKMEESL
jgi:uncharacterized membrane protein